MVSMVLRPSVLRPSVCVVQRLSKIIQSRAPGELSPRHLRGTRLRMQQRGQPAAYHGKPTSKNEAPTQPGASPPLPSSGGDQAVPLAAYLCAYGAFGALTNSLGHVLRRTGSRTAQLTRELIRCLGRCYLRWLPPWERPRSVRGSATLTPTMRLTILTRPC